MKFASVCEWFRERNKQNFVLVAEIPCEWTFVRVARLQKEVGMKLFFSRHEFLTKNAPIISPSFLDCICGSEKIPQNSCKILPPKNFKNHRRASAGAQGETFATRFASNRKCDGVVHSAQEATQYQCNQPKGCSRKMPPSRKRGLLEKGAFQKSSFSRDSWEFRKKGKDPHPQDKIQHLDFTKDPRPLYYKTPPCALYHNMSVVRPFSVLSKDEIGP